MLMSSHGLSDRIWAEFITHQENSFHYCELAHNQFLYSDWPFFVLIILQTFYYFTFHI